MYDIVGDIHGHAVELKKLLAKMGYQSDGYAYQHPSRKIVFVGDFIDRGPDNLGAIQIAKATVEAGNGFAVMGNHEYNAIAYHTSKEAGGYFREHSKKNYKQHEAVVKQLSCYQVCEAIDWFRTLPVALELDGINVVHASWQPADIQTINRYIESHGKFTGSFLVESESKGAELNLAIERVLKGPEVQLRDGMSFKDKAGHERHRARVKWWKPQSTDELFDYALEVKDENFTISREDVSGIESYPDKAKPLFFGHYCWMAIQGLWLPMRPVSTTASLKTENYALIAGTARNRSMQRNLSGYQQRFNAFQGYRLPLFKMPINKTSHTFLQPSSKSILEGFSDGTLSR